MNTEQIMERINSSPYLKENHLQVEMMQEKEAIASIIIDDNILNPHGYAHGGAIYSVADLAAGAACCYGGHSVVTLSGSINYIKAGSGVKLLAHAEVISKGGHTAVIGVRITNEKEILIAQATFTMYFVDQDRYDVKR